MLAVGGPTTLADHVDAIAHAANAGRRGAIKIAFDLRENAVMPRPGFVLDVHPPHPTDAVLARRGLLILEKLPAGSQSE